MGRVINTPGMGTYGSSWQHAGYSGNGNVESLLGSLKGRPAIVCGNAAGVFQELEDARSKLNSPEIFAVNDAGMYVKGLDHWVSLHAKNLEIWKQVRWLTNHEDEHTIYHSIEDGFDYSWEGLCPLFALSGYFAMQVAHLMGAGLIVLCGCPGSSEQRFFESFPRTDMSYGGGNTSQDQAIQEQLIREMIRVPDLQEKVRSMSGWTRDTFGGL